MRILAAAFVSFAALVVAGCGGSSPAPPPPSGNFSNASLKGQYAYVMSGIEGTTGAHIARIGSFTADGAGNITAGLEDVLNLSTGQPASVIPFTGGTYTVLASGRGLALLKASGSTLQISLTLQSASAGFAIETDLSGATSGPFYLQNPSSFTASALSANYVFDLSGVTFVPSAAAPISLIGEFNANGAGVISGGLMDSNNGNSTPPGATAIPAGTYAMDPTNGSTFGRGTMSFSGYNFAFYIIDSTHIVILEEDQLGGTSGQAYLQSSPVPTQNSQLTGSFVYLIGGASVTGSQGPIAEAARFTTDGSGSLSAFTLDDNNDGNYTHVSQASNASISLDTNNPGSGRGTFVFSNSGNTYSYVFYLVSSSQAVVQDVSAGIVGDGPLMAQSSGPFTLSNLVGNFALNWSGIQIGANAATPSQEEYVGQYVLSNSSSSNISGLADYANLGLSTSTISTDLGLKGTLTINGDGTANNHYQFAVQASPSFTINFQAYFVNPSTVFMINSDSNRTTVGLIQQQQE